MAVTATLIEQGHNRLRYLVACDTTGGGTVTITTTGAASPDLQTDSLAGPVKECALAFDDGLGKLAAGAKTQAQSRAIWMAQDADSVLGNALVPRCLPRLTAHTLTGGSGNVAWSIDADVDGSGHPTVVVTVPGNSVGQRYLDIQTQGGIGI
jgi:hypothetical protein